MRPYKTLLLTLIIFLTLFIFWFTFYLLVPSQVSPLNLRRKYESNRNRYSWSTFTGKGLRVWPEQLYGDRIKEQLELTSYTNTTKKIHAMHPSFKVPMGGEYFRQALCPVDKCEFVQDETEADAVLFKDSVPLSLKRKRPNQIWILYILESPLVSGNTANGEASVNWTATYREDSDLVTPYEKWVSYEKTHVKIAKKNYAAGKTKMVAWFVSNCEAFNDRMEYALELQKYIDVDIYGRCGPLKCKKSSKECGMMLDRSYKFYLSFENANCRDYITEKFFVNGLGHDVIPIVMGAHPDDYRRVAPKHSYIHVEDFPSARDLADYLYLVDSNDHLYNSYFQWKGTGEFIDTKFFCRLCAMLHNNRGPKFYPDFRTWWAGENNSICRKHNWQ